jgi:hypothetical protein
LASIDRQSSIVARALGSPDSKPPIYMPPLFIEIIWKVIFTSRLIGVRRLPLTDCHKGYSSAPVLPFSGALPVSITSITSP